MIRGIYTSNTGLNVLQNKLENIANNLANINTYGYKQDKTSYTSFKEIFLTLNGNKKIGSITYGTRHSETVTDFDKGSLNETNNDMDFAVEGKGFFTLQTPNGFRYTRNGSFQRDKDGYLVDANGYRVLGVSGNVKVIDGKIDQDFRIVDFQDLNFVYKKGKNIYAADPQAGLIPVNNPKIKQGFLETSNVDLLKNVTELLTTSNYYSLNSRILMTQDKILEKTVNQVGNIK
jgi:flagellar basal-body rod protein FlgG